MNAMKNARLSKVDESDEMLSNVRLAIKQSESYTYDEAVAYWGLISAGNAFGAALSSDRADRPANSNKPLFTISEYGTDVATGFNTLNFAVALGGALANAGLPPGVASSFPGLKALITTYNQIQGAAPAGASAAGIATSVFKNVDYTLMQSLKNFVPFFESMIGKNFMLLCFYFSKNMFFDLFSYSSF